MLQLPIYLDNNATTPCDPRVVEAMLPYFTRHFGNAASKSHAFGWEAEEAVELAREQVAQLIGAGPKEIVFTSGATEADNLALKGVFEAYSSKGNHIITVCTEHKAVLDTCRHLEKMGASITYLPVDSGGLISLPRLESAVTEKTILIAVMYANNEIGVIQPIKQISDIARKHKVLFFCDAAQAIGKIDVDVNKDGIDLMAMSAHKIYGPKGVGALYARRKNPRATITAQMDGGGHERGMRSGTLNVAGIVGFGKACELCMSEMLEEQGKIASLRNKLEKGIAEMKDVFINGHIDFRLPNITNISFYGTDGNQLLTVLAKNIALSSGSACTSALTEPSYVLKALGVNDEQAYSSIRFGVGRFNTEEEIDYAIEQLGKALSSLRQKPMTIK
ncbi:MAG: IscS subfamily cysteine desulfurase [Bacteroidetes bacterium]|nr:IscS subfamily cysteine desulfurase [Bacteroidota bacterium]MBS1973097.1 IscS subfamily cysteine desulfurase [Bacteroidota bacterium]